MNFTSNIILSLVFFLLAIWMFRGVYRTYGKLKYKDRMWSANRILFLICGILVASTGFVYGTIYDFIRMVCMLACISGFLLLRDGIGEKGLYSMGRFIAWEDVRHYDYQITKKIFRLYVTAKGKNRQGKEEEYPSSVNLRADQAEEIKQYLKGLIGRKYTRMKK